MLGSELSDRTADHDIDAWESVSEKAAEKSLLLRGIVIASPGGLTHGGGVGSVTRTIASWMAAHCPDVRVVDEPAPARNPDAGRSCRSRVDPRPPAEPRVWRRGLIFTATARI